LKLSELGIIPVVIFTDPVTCLIAVDVQSSYSVSDYENSSSPGIIKASIFFIIIAVVWLIKVIRSVEFLVVEDAQKRQLDCTQSISILGITSFTLHLSCPVSLFTWKFCCCVGKTLLSRNEIRIIVDWILTILWAPCLTYCDCQKRWNYQGDVSYFHYFIKNIILKNYCGLKDH